MTSIEKKEDEIQVVNNLQQSRWHVASPRQEKNNIQGDRTSNIIERIWRLHVKKTTGLRRLKVINVVKST